MINLYRAVKGKIKFKYRMSIHGTTNSKIKCRYKILNY